MPVPVPGRTPPPGVGVVVVPPPGGVVVVPPPGGVTTGGLVVSLTGGIALVGSA